VSLASSVHLPPAAASPSAPVCWPVSGQQVLHLPALVWFYASHLSCIHQKIKSNLKLLFGTVSRDWSCMIFSRLGELLLYYNICIRVKNKMHAAYRGNAVNSLEAIRSANSNCFCCSSNLSASLTSFSLSPAFPFNAAATSRVCLPFTVSIHQPNCQSMGRPTAKKFLHKKPTFPPQSASPSPPKHHLSRWKGKTHLLA
jgi:hypothetical protein